MLQNSSRASESKILPLQRSAPGRCDRLVDEVPKFRNRWPFTVTLEHVPDSRLHGQQDHAGFVS